MDAEEPAAVREAFMSGRGGVMSGRSSGSLVLLTAFALLLVGCGTGGQYGAGPEQTDATSFLTDEDARGGDDARPIEEVIRAYSSGIQIVRHGDGEYSFRIRGTDTLDNQQEPLIIIDGAPMPLVPASQALRGLRSEEIDSVEVLRDIASTSIYGTRGGAGVILITTKDRSDAW
jgi:TonB-dependent SusC/RagA subfamily outer membrane receptor